MCSNSARQLLFHLACPRKHRRLWVTVPGRSHRCSMGIGGHWAREYCGILGLCTLLASAFTGILLSASGRQDLLWCKADTLALFFVIAAGAIVLLVGLKWLHWLTGTRFLRYFNHLIYVVYALGIVQLITPNALAAVHIPVNWGYGALLAVGGLCSLISFSGLRWNKRLGSDIAVLTPQETALSNRRASARKAPMDAKSFRQFPAASTHCCMEMLSKTNRTTEGPAPSLPLPKAEFRSSRRLKEGKRSE